MNNKKKSTDEEAREILERVAQESETIGTSSLRRVADRVKTHVSAHDANQNEWAEVWGTRIGRALSVIFFIVLVSYLIKTYILHV